MNCEEFGRGSGKMWMDSLWIVCMLNNDYYDPIMWWNDIIGDVAKYLGKLLPILPWTVLDLSCKIKELKDLGKNVTQSLYDIWI